MESRLGEGHVVVEREGSAANVAQPVRAQVVPQLLHRSAEVGRSAAASELQRVRLVGSAAHGDRDELVGQLGLVNVAAGDAFRWGLAVAGWWAFAPARGRHELAAAEHVRSAAVAQRSLSVGCSRDAARTHTAVLLCAAPFGGVSQGLFLERLRVSQFTPFGECMEWPILIRRIVN